MLLLGLLIVLYCTCYYSLSRAVKDIPVGLAYATWSGTGILVVSTLGWRFTASIRIPRRLSVWPLLPPVSLS
jgi:multidrug transporter EmrE-like cation transporter